MTIFMHKDTNTKKSNYKVRITAVVAAVVVAAAAAAVVVVAVVVAAAVVVVVVVVIYLNCKWVSILSSGKRR
jgi:hypothetical protein